MICSSFYYHLESAAFYRHSYWFWILLSRQGTFTSKIFFLPLPTVCTYLDPGGPTQASVYSPSHPFQSWNFLVCSIDLKAFVYFAGSETTHISVPTDLGTLVSFPQWNREAAHQCSFTILGPPRHARSWGTGRKKTYLLFTTKARDVHYQKAVSLPLISPQPKTRQSLVRINEPTTGWCRRRRPPENTQPISRHGYRHADIITPKA